MQSQCALVLSDPGLGQALKSVGVNSLNSLPPNVAPDSYRRPETYLHKLLARGRETNQA